jgi:hypothetical protein
MGTIVQVIGCMIGTEEELSLRKIESSIVLDVDGNVEKSFILTSENLKKY